MSLSVVTTIFETVYTHYNYSRKSVAVGNRLLLFLILLPFTGFAQYSNDWIKPGQTYYRLPVARPGVYRLTHADLQTAGVPVASIDPRLIQIYHRGKEVAISVQGQADAVFNPEDYLEFFGTANDGTLDKDLYKPATAQPHSYYNLYSDTTAYFLTWPLTPVAGKRIDTFFENNVSGLPKETSHFAERLLINKNEYSTGLRESDVLQYTHFDEGEGWTGTAIRQNQSIDYTVDGIESPVSSDGNPLLEILLVGRDAIPHTAQLYVGATTGSLRLLDTYSFSGFAANKLSYGLSWSDVSGDGKLVVRIVVPPEANNRLQVSVSYLKVTFPQSFNVGGVVERTFHLDDSPDKQYLELENAGALRLWDVSDPDNPLSVGTTRDGSTLKAVVPATTHFLFAFESVLTTTLKKVSFRFFNPDLAEYVILSHPLLMQPALGYTNPVKAYAAYRASDAGGGYDTLVTDMYQLYNQFNYGETSPRAIFEFMRYLVSEGAPRYLFLIGKGRDVSSGFHRLINPAASVLKDLVPSAGIPASDIAFTAGLGSTLYEPAVATGRLTASTSAQVASYLNKIKETESGLLQPWHKQGLHLSGGILPIELTVFRNFLDGYKNIAEGPYYGGAFSTIAKQDPNPVELINISDQVNAGVNLITFFGHSSPGTIDIDIGYVSDPTMGYNNPGKYPAFLINGCNAGNFFTGSTSFGEDWILTANKGARNFIAHSSFGFTNSLWYYSNLFYETGFADSLYINKGIGEVQQEVARLYMSVAPENMANITQVQQMMLLGDPAVKLFNFGKPDYEITAASLSLVSFDDKPVTALSDSFAVQVIIKNRALADPRPVKIRTIRMLPDGTELTYDSLVAAIANTDTVRITLPRVSGAGGSNQFTVTVDFENAIEELNESNNAAVMATVIPSNATLNLFPVNYAIVNNANPRLTWQATDLLSASRVFEVEVDTTTLFNSPFLIQQEITGRVMASLEITVLNSDTTVYYWRTRFKQPQSGESAEWATSSFVYILNGAEGWAQVEPEQIMQNKFTDLKLTTDHTFEFEATQTAVAIETFGSASSLPYTEVSVKIDGSEYNLATQGQPCRNNTLNLLAFTKTSAVPYAPLPLSFQDPRTCGREPQVINSFLASELESGQDDLAAWINAAGVSDSVVLFSIGNAGYSTWSSTVKTKLGELGIATADLESLVDGEPVIIFGKKGAAAGSARIIRSQVTPAPEQIITANETITGRTTSGSMKSVTIGPAAAWKQFIATTLKQESEDDDAFTLSGTTLSGEDTLIAEGVLDSFDLTSISASHYPYLKVEWITTDDVNLTPAQWRNWFVLYEAPAEGILVKSGTEASITVQEGAEWETRFGFTNISDKPFVDSLRVELEFLTQVNQQREQQAFRIPSPLPGDTTFFRVSTPTVGKVGLNDIRVQVNRRILPEPYYDNNIISLPGFLQVLPDITPPLLEVTVDGRLLRNGDFVSPHPTILFTLRDENPFLLKSDTAGVDLFLSYPCAVAPCAFKRISLKGDEISISPATTSSDFQITFTPQLQPGDYVLRAELQDVSGNSAPSPYEISFHVDADQSVQFKGAYPNPSSQYFYFQFVLTGSDLPQEFSLSIYSLTGSLIRSFTEEDLSGFTIGTNELVWEAQEATGTELPSGVYTYRMYLRTASYQQQVTGKLVLIR